MHVACHDRAVTVLFDADVDVQYGFIFLHPEADDRPTDFGQEGQINGLCGVPAPDVLAMMTGTHSGDVPFVVEVLDAQPELGTSWEDVVEASFTAPTVEYELAAFEEFYSLILPAEGTYRARFHATGMDRARRAEGVRTSADPDLDRYLLQLWPAPLKSDAILRQTSRSAQYWHRVAQGVDTA